MQCSFSGTFRLGYDFLQADKARGIFLQITGFVGIFIRIGSDDNKCIDDNDKCVMMITNLHLHVKLHVV